MRDGQSERLADCELTRADDRIAVTGEIDAANAGAIADRVCGALGGTVVVVDLRAVTFFSAAGVHLLRRIAAAARTSDTIVQVLCSSAVRHTARLCGVTELPGLVLDRSDRREPDPTGDREAPS
ncbi:anti-anti-sigma factor [Lentzea atacamensis]|uniref:Anti-anti-sigma factor n=1 Tax=Lentzea atacamensis TaxID=531938 RepID=A0ABX9EHN2_9PSEU|nr:STAS domain-containing protein [Lentzea atacamensis]RAS70039.1 anti-anti-sigma factor [Lentzea atacamensis]